MNTNTIELTETQEPRPKTLTEEPPTVHVVYFSGGDGRFAELLGRWFDFYHASRCPWPVRVLSDRQTDTGPIGHLLGHKTLVRVSTDEWGPVMREGNAFDRKSAIICAALPALPPRSVVVDSDAFFLRDPSDMLEEFLVLPFAMAEDAGERIIELKDGPVIPEQSSSVMIFGSGILGLGSGEFQPETPEPGPETRAALAAQYARAWGELAKTRNQSALEHDIREQRAWSIVKHRVKAPLLPRECNDSRFWKGPTERTRIYHAHGKEKFVRG